MNEFDQQNRATVIKFWVAISGILIVLAYVFYSLFFGDQQIMQSWP